ncbi:hypothetical protein CQW23_04402 [Capsicum baccatum]|uniref:Uncharacterized protein n=1 Tax=Capsicum baccatum TaxID=33114 RepID=A0A2G2XEJ3_CAPBA|nr:hypothetical protein CQW23_04402 [Capsicum baccatum]
MHRTSALRSSVAPAVGGSSSGGSGTPPGHSLKSLLVSLGVNPMVLKVEEVEKTSMLMKLSKMNEGFSSSTGGPWDLLVVYIGGKRTTSPSSPIASTGSSTMQPPRTEQRNNNTRNTLAELIEKNAVIIVARLQCYMCFMLQTLMESLVTANYTVIQGEEVEEAHMLEELSKLEEGSSSSSNSNGGGPRSLPAVYIGGKFVGGVDEVLTAHAKCELVPMLRAAGAI